MPDVLGFDPNRDLAFKSDRPRGFDQNRGLAFKPGRDLSFSPGRDLGFGKRGPVFRGFVCPVCAVSVTEDQPTCDQCGAVFEKPTGTHARSPRARPPAPMPPSRPIVAPPSRMPLPPPPLPVSAPPSAAPRAHPPSPKRLETQICIYCGARLTSGDAFCWNCGNRVAMGTRILP